MNNMDWCTHRAEQCAARESVQFPAHCSTAGRKASNGS